MIDSTLSPKKIEEEDEVQIVSEKTERTVPVKQPVVMISPVVT